MPPDTVNSFVTGEESPGAIEMFAVGNPISRPRPSPATTVPVTANEEDPWTSYRPNAGSDPAGMLRGDSWTRGEGTFIVRWPPSALALTDANMVSAVLRVTWKDGGKGLEFAREGKRFRVDIAADTLTELPPATNTPAEQPPSRGRRPPRRGQAALLESRAE